MKIARITFQISRRWKRRNYMCYIKSSSIFTNCTGKFLSMTSDGLSAAVRFSSSWLHGFHNECSNNAECDDVPFAGNLDTTSTSTAITSTSTATRELQARLVLVQISKGSTVLGPVAARDFHVAVFDSVAGVLARNACLCVTCHTSHASFTLQTAHCMQHQCSGKNGNNKGIHLFQRK